MKPISKLAAVATAGAAVIALSALPASAATAHAWPGQTPAVFVQTDDTAGNTIVAYTRTAADGLQQLASYPTGGNGGATMGSVVDHLSSQGSLAFDRRAGLLYAVNAGSNTITVFRVRGDGLIRSQVISSGGQFPVSIAVHGNQVFALNGHLALAETGAGAVATFAIASDGTLTQLGSAATGQAATCWITAAPQGTLYPSNAGSGTKSTLSTEPDGTITQLGTTPTDPGTTDAAVSSDGQYLYVQAGEPGNIDAYHIGPGGSLTETGSVTVPGAIGGEGIAAS